MRRYIYTISNAKGKERDVNIYASHRITSEELITLYCNQYGYKWKYKSFTSSGTFKGRNIKEYNADEAFKIEQEQFDIIINTKRGVLDNV